MCTFLPHYFSVLLFKSFAYPAYYSVICKHTKYYSVICKHTKYYSVLQKHSHQVVCFLSHFLHWTHQSSGMLAITLVLLTPYSLLLTPYSLLLTPYSLLLTPYSLLLTPYSPLLTPYSLPLTPYSSSLTPHSLLLAPHPRSYSLYSSLLIFILKFQFFNFQLSSLLLLTLHSHPKFLLPYSNSSLLSLLKLILTFLHRSFTYSVLW